MFTLAVDLARVKCNLRCAHYNCIRCHCELQLTIIIAAEIPQLRRAHASTYFKRTSHLLTNLIRWTIETGLVTFIMALAELILWLALAKWNFHYTMSVSFPWSYKPTH